MWNQAVHTDREVTTNRPDIIIKKKREKKTCTLIDVAIPADRNVVQKEAEIKLKYNSLCIEISECGTEMCGYTGNKWSHWNSNEKLKEKIWKLYQEDIRWIQYKRLLYLEHHTIRKVLQCEA